MAMFDAKDPESLSDFIRATAPDAADESIRKAIVFGWWLLPMALRTDENLERQIRKLVDDAIRDFKVDKDRFLAPEENFSNPSDIALGRYLLLKVGMDRFGLPDDRIRERVAAITDGERLKRLFQKLYSASGWDDLMAES